MLYCAEKNKTIVCDWEPSNYWDIYHKNRMSFTDGNEIHVPGPKLEMNLCLCTRKSVFVYVCMLEIFCFLSFKDLITSVGGKAIYSGFESKNIGMKEFLAWCHRHSIISSISYCNQTLTLFYTCPGDVIYFPFFSHPSLYVKTVISPAV